MTFSMHQRRIRNELKLEMLLAALLQKLGLAPAWWATVRSYADFTFRY